MPISLTTSINSVLGTYDFSLLTWDVPYLVRAFFLAMTIWFIFKMFLSCMVKRR